MKRTPLNPRRSKPRRKGKPAPRIKPKRQENPEHLRLIRAMPCIACEIAGIQQTTPTESHHLRTRPDGTDYGTGVKAPDEETIPLCAHHHWNGSASIYTRKGFEAEFGTERNLLEIIQKRIAGTEAA